MFSAKPVSVVWLATHANNPDPELMICLRLYEACCCCLFCLFLFLVLSKISSYRASVTVYFSKVIAAVSV